MCLTVGESEDEHDMRKRMADDGLSNDAAVYQIQLNQAKAASRGGRDGRLTRERCKGPICPSSFALCRRTMLGRQAVSPLRGFASWPRA